MTHTKLFRAAAEAVTVHALKHLRVMGEGESTIAKLATAVSGETFEFKTVHPNFGGVRLVLEGSCGAY